MEPNLSDSTQMGEIIAFCEFTDIYDFGTIYSVVFYHPYAPHGNYTVTFVVYLDGVPYYNNILHFKNIAEAIDTYKDKFGGDY